MGADNVKPWGEAIRSALAAEPDRWFPVVELVDQYTCLIPPEDVQRRAEQRKRHGSSSTARAAASMIIGGLIYTGIRRGHYERRLTPDGRLEVRATPALADVLAASSLGEIARIRRARILADAGLMTLAEAAVVIGVAYGQVLSYMHQGLLHGTKFAKVWAVPAADVHSFKRPPDVEELLADAALMTPTEAAAVMGVTRERVYDYVRSGLLPGTKFANRWGVSAADVCSFKPPRSPMRAVLADAGLMTPEEAAAVIGVTAGQVRFYVRRGLLPATKMENGWVGVPAGYVHGFKRPPYGRPYTQPMAWDRILGGQVDLDNPHVYGYRGTVSRWSGEADVVAALLKRQGVIVGGVQAAVVHGALLNPRAGAAHVYVAEASVDGRRSDADLAQGLVVDPLGEVVVRAVATDAWRRLRRCAKPEEGVLYVPAAAAALDLVLSPDPDERQAAEMYTPTAVDAPVGL